MQKDIWVKGVPIAPEPDRLYAVLSQQNAGVAVGNILRGEDCNWSATNIIAHWPIPATMTKAQALSVFRRMYYDFAQYVSIESPWDYCCWSQNDYDDVDSSCWHTTCDNAFYLTDEGPDDNGMNFCCYCGKRLIVSGYVDSDQSEV